MRRILIFGIFLALLSVPALAQTQEGKQVLDWKKEVQQVRKRSEELRKNDLEELKKGDPELYKKIMKQVENEKEINKVVTSYRQGKLSAEEAQRKIYPLVEENLQNYINSLGLQIEQAEKKLKSLKEAKKNPDKLIKKHIDALLGRSVFSPDDF